MLPVYDPKPFETIDLRKYHIRSVKDVVKFHEFVISRMEECKHILNKMNNKLITFDVMQKALREQQEKQQASYGAAPKPQEDKPAQAEIQSIDKTAEQEHEELLNEMRQAVANETVAEAAASEDPNERLQVEYGKYKAVDGKHRVMYFRDGGNGFQMCKEADVPDDIKEHLLQGLGKDGQSQPKSTI